MTIRAPVIGIHNEVQHTLRRPPGGPSTSTTRPAEPRSTSSRIDSPRYTPGTVQYMTRRPPSTTDKAADAQAALVAELEAATQRYKAAEATAEAARAELATLILDTRDRHLMTPVRLQRVVEMKDDDGKVHGISRTAYFRLLKSGPS